MKKLSLVILLLFSSTCFSLGAITHNYVAEQVALKVGAMKPTLRNVLTLYSNAYLVGSDYPDTGFVPGGHYGEASHWPRFINPFINYINKHYQGTLSSAEKAHKLKLEAFVMGVGTHYMADYVSHWVYYDFVAENDFHAKGSDSRVGGKDWEKAQNVMDPGSDFYIIVKKGIHDHPIVWWVPVADLVRVYQIMQHHHVINYRVTSAEIIESNAIYYMATGLTEDLIAYPMYAYNAYYRIPWGMAHFEDPNPKYGALPTEIDQSANYILNVWSRFNPPISNPYSSNVLFSIASLPAKYQMISSTKIEGIFASFIRAAINKGILEIKPSYDAFGDVSFSASSIHFKSHFSKIKFETQLYNLENEILSKKI